MGQYCFAGWRLSSSVTLPAGGLADHRQRTQVGTGNAAGGRASRPPAGAWTVGPPTLHSRPVMLQHVRATPCFT